MIFDHQLPTQNLLARSMFDPAALNSVVQRALADSPTIPEDAHGAFLTVANQDGIKAVIAVKLVDTWTVKAVVDHAWGSSSVNYGVAITGTF